MHRAGSTIDVEHHVIRQIGQYLQTFVAAFQSPLALDLLGHVENDDVEPRLPARIDDVTSPILEPTHRAIGAKDAIRYLVLVSHGYLLGYFLLDALDIVTVNKTTEAIPRE